MSSAGTITVDITARATQLRTELALSKAELAKFSGEVKSLSNAMVAAGAQGSAALGSALNSAVRDAAAASQRVAGLTNELAKIEPVAKGMHGSISTATREFRALFDELSSGRTRMVPGTLAIIGQRVFGLGPAALLAVGGVAALAGAIGYLVVKAIDAENALQRLKLGADFNDLDVSKAQLKQYADEIGKDGDVILGGMMKIAASGDELHALAIATKQYADVSGEKAPAAVKAITEAVKGEHLSLAKLHDLFPGVTEEARENYEKIQQLGDGHKTAAALIGLVNAQVEKSKKDLIEYKSGWTSAGNDVRLTTGYIEEFTGGMLPLSSALEGGITLWDKWGKSIEGAYAKYKNFMGGDKAQIPTAVDRVKADLTAENSKKTDELQAKSAKLATTVATTAEANQKLVGAAMQSAEAFDTEGRRADELKVKIEQFKKALAAPGDTADQIKTLTRAKADAEYQLAQIQNKNAFRGTGFSNAGQELIAEAKERISEINANEAIGGKERVALIQATYAELLKNAKLNKAQLIEVETAKNKELAAAAKADKAEEARDARAEAQTEIEIARIGLQAKRDQLDQEVIEGKKTRQQELRELRDFAAEELRLNLASLDASVKGYDTDAEAFKEAERKKRIERERTRAELDKIDKEIAQADKKTAKDDADNWKGAVNEIVNAETKFEDDLLSGRKTFMQSVYALTSSFIKKEIEQDTAYYTRKLLLGQEAFAQDKSLETGGFLVHLLTETKKTSSTVAGEAARLTAKESAAAAGKAAEATEGAATISKDAAKAAAGAYSAVAGIPIVGPILAPIAAGTAFAAVMAYESLASLDVGAWNVPRDMPAMIHKGETVVPKTFAQGLREGGGGFAGAHNSTTNNTVHLAYQPQVQNDPSKSLEDHLEQDGHVMRRWLMNQVRNGSLRF